MRAEKAEERGEKGRWLTRVPLRQWRAEQEQAHRPPAQGKAHSWGFSPQRRLEMPRGRGYCESGAGPGPEGGSRAGALTRSAAGAACDGPAPRPGSRGSLLPGCGCSELRGHLASAAGTTSASAAPAARRNASTSPGGHHLQTADKTKIGRRRWKPRAKEQKDGSGQRHCLQAPESMPLSLNIQHEQFYRGQVESALKDKTKLEKRVRGQISYRRQSYKRGTVSMFWFNADVKGDCTHMGGEEKI